MLKPQGLRDKPLTFAASRGRENVVRLLLEAGADINARELCGQTALIYTIKWRHEAITRLLLIEGADSEAKD